jgi:hypothetical protein
VQRGQPARQSTARVHTGDGVHEKAAVSVKGGENVDVTMVRDLAHVVKREKAPMGVFITLAEPTKPMHTEAVKESFYETSYGRHFTASNRNRRATANDKQPTIPVIDPSGVKKAAREASATAQDALPF